MLKLARMGAVIAPPVPAFYDRPGSLDDLVNHTVQRTLDLFDIHLDVAERWNGFRARAGVARVPARRLVARRSRSKPRR